MTDYQVFARKYRPQKFFDIVGQETIVTILTHAIAYKRIGHAYLFSGPHGTGKTSTARLFAKALNCKQLSSDHEPCDQCSSCIEIAGSYSLDVLEIDGASNRGIEDIRKLNETIAYAPSSGTYKIYLIDEVHMLTKEAFNALLKSLEEPPPHVKFFFATTEAHLIPQTILSRCQRLNFKRIPAQKIVEKLKKISSEIGLKVESEALHLLASLAEGGMRDAESLFDELVSFQKEVITVKGVQDLFGLPEDELFVSLDHAFTKTDYIKAFDIVEHIFSSGKNISYFLERLAAHFRNHFLNKNPAYTQDQLLEILEILVSAQNEIKVTPSKKTFLELLLLRILKLSQNVSLESLVRRLEQLEQKNHKPKIVQETTKTLEKPLEKLLDQPVASNPTLPIPSSTPAAQVANLQEKNRVDTLIRFAAKELNGSLKKE